MMEKKQQIRSTEIQDILTKMPHWILIWSNFFILLLILGFFLATWFIKYPDVITGEVKITSVNPIYKAEANESGRLESILVKENENVKKGQLIAVIKTNALLKDITIIKNILDTVSIEADKFVFPLDSIPTLSLGELSTSFALFENEYYNYRLRKSLQYYSSLNSHQLSVSSLELRLKLLKEQRKSEAENINLSKKDFQRTKALFEEGVIAEQEYEQQKIELRNKENNIKNVDLSINQLHQSISEAKRASKESQIIKELERSSSFKNTVQAFTKLKEDIKSWEERFLIKSEIDGVVSLVGRWNEKQSISKGDHFCSIIPTQTGGFIAKLKAPATNSGKIKIGQKVNIKLFNYPESEYGFITGQISSISIIPTSEGHYWVEIKLPNKLQTSYNIEIPYSLEISGTAEIITEDLRLCERFFNRLKGIIS